MSPTSQLVASEVMTQVSLMLAVPLTRVQVGVLGAPWMSKVPW